MAPRAKVQDEVPVVSLGLLLSSPDAPVKVSKKAREEIAEAVAKLPHEKLPRGIKRVQLYASTQGRKNLIDEDQHFSASCSYKEDGDYEAMWVLAVCHNQENGWFIRPVSK